MKPRKKTKTPRRLLAIFLAALSSATIGFSAWAIVEESSVLGQIVAADVSYTQINIFTAVSVDSDSFHLGKNGMVVDHTIVNSGNYIIRLTIDNNVLKKSSFLSSTNAFKMKSTLTDKTTGSTFLNYWSGFGASIDSNIIANPTKEAFDSTHVVFSFETPIDTTKSISTILLTYNFSGDLSACYSKFPSLTIKVEAIS